MRLFLASVVFGCAAITMTRCSMSVTDDADASDAHEDPCPKGVPDAAEYSCDPVSLDAAVCTGGPPQCTTCDASLGYPLNCSVKLPEPTTFCGPLTCYCYGANFWTCPQ
jgi:hypothetical protein